VEAGALNKTPRGLGRDVKVPSKTTGREPQRESREAEDGGKKKGKRKTVSNNGGPKDGPLGPGMRPHGGLVKDLKGALRKLGKEPQKVPQGAPKGVHIILAE
jgi:hypothetical protein